MTEQMRSDVVRCTVRCTRAALAGAIALGAAGCQYLQFLPFLKAPVDTRPRGRTSVARGPAFASAAASAGANGDGVAPGADWGAYNGDLTTGQRWSPLAQITAENVSTLRPACTAELGERVPMPSGPVVVHGTLYVTSAVSTWAIDAATCAQRWRHTYRYDPRPDYDLKVNRGV